MKNYSKIGGKKGKPAYRTPSNFKHRKQDRVSRAGPQRRRRV